MIKITKHTLTFIVLLLLYGCPDSNKLKDFGFVVKNQSGISMKITIFNISIKDRVGGDNFPIENGGSYGSTITENLLRYSEDYTPLGLSGDSAVIVLGNQYLIHKYDQINKVFTPDKGNIFRISSYTQEFASLYSMELNQEDYENATPCNDDPICGE